MMKDVSCTYKYLPQILQRYCLLVQMNPTLCKASRSLWPTMYLMIPSKSIQMPIHPSQTPTASFDELLYTPLPRKQRKQLYQIH